MFHVLDVRYAFRLLRRSPFFTLLTAVVLSGGLGLSIFTFSFLYTAMLKPLPLSGGEQIVRIEQKVNGRTTVLDAADVAAIRPVIRGLTEVGAFTSRSFVVGSAGQRRALGATATEASMFELTRTRPLLGRALVKQDQLRGAEPVIVLSHRTWRAVFGSDPAIVNQNITLNGKPARVVGVMPQGYAFPVASDAWVPLSDEVLAITQPGVAALDVYARLAEGVTTAQASAELTGLLERARQNRVVRDTAASGPLEVTVRSFQMAQFGDQGPLFLATLNILAALILLLACINVTNLLLARANERAREVAVRLALGASRGRLVMQSMWETILLCLLGGVFAVALAAWALRFINDWAQVKLEGNLAFWWVWQLETPGLIAACIFVTATIALLGAVVSARAAGVGFTAVLRDASARSGGRREGRLARVLVVTQVTAVTVLMFFGVMTSIVAYRVATIDVGYDTRNLLSASIALPEASYESRAARAAFFQSVADNLERASPLESALLRSELAGIDDEAGVLQLESGAATGQPRAYVQALQGPLSTLGVDLQGRGFNSGDGASGAPVAIVSRSFADKYWPGRSPVGERLRLAGGNETEWRTIVGVASNVLLGNPLSRERSADAVYVPLQQSDATGTTILFKHRGDVAAAQASLYEALAAADPKLPPPHVATYAEILDKTALLAKSVMKLFGLCFGFALLLAVSGTYGLMARTIGRRTREIGIRRALGATDALVVRLLLGLGTRQVGVGVMFAAPVMAMVGFGFWQFFPIGLMTSLGSGLIVAASIAGVVLIATYVPTRRVLRTSARDALWTD